MNLHKMLLARKEAGQPVRVGLIGAGKFGTMFLAQAGTTDGLQVMAIADLDVERARAALRTTGWGDAQFAARSLDEARKGGGTHLTDDAEKLIAADGLDIVIEATGDPKVGIAHCLKAIAQRKHVVMVTVEADVVAGPLLARKAHEAGVVYSLAWGDQPALICEHVDWARACGFKVVAAGKGTRYHPSYHRSSPDTVWEILDKYLKIGDRRSINPKMFNSFIDGSKSGIEMTAVCNATGLVPQANGLGFPPASRFELAEVCKPKSDGGRLDFAGTTEVVSSVDRTERDVPHHIAMGTYVVIEADSDYARRCFREYHMLPDQSGKYASLYRPTHMIGLELGLSVASVALRREPTGCPSGFRADVVACAKRAMRKGEVLDGEGGACVWGKQMPAEASLAQGALPLGLAHKVMLTRDIAEGAIVGWADVQYDAEDSAVRLRREMEAAFARPNLQARAAE
ncbi:MAG: flagellar biosynthesis protein FlgA [Alphaproteobacteria bacterium]|nr:flagellar biosynthesis protein FlgA [Alphaproteobacteria bacterium]